jgi:hypothetical protein
VLDRLGQPQLLVQLLGREGGWQRTIVAGRRLVEVDDEVVEDLTSFVVFAASVLAFVAYVVAWGRAKQAHR